MSRGSKVGGTKRRVLDVVGFTAIIVLFLLYMVPFILVLLNSFKQKRDIIKSPFSWLFTIKGLSFDNFVKAFNQMNFLNAFKNSLVVTVTATVLVTVLAAMLAYYIVRNVNVFSNIIFALMVASMIIPFQAIMIPLVSVYGGTLNILNHRLTLIFMHTGFAQLFNPAGQRLNAFIQTELEFRCLGVQLRDDLFSLALESLAAG